MGMPETHPSFHNRIAELEQFASQVATRLEGVERYLDDVSRGATHSVQTPSTPHGREVEEVVASLLGSDTQEMMRAFAASKETCARINLFLQRDDVDRAIEALEGAVLADPTCASAMSLIAYLEAKCSNAKDAVAWYRRAAAAMVTKHNLYGAAGAYEEALTVDGILLEDRIACIADLGALYERLELPQDALATYRKALALDPRPRTDAMRAIEQCAQSLEAQGVTASNTNAPQWKPVSADALASLIGAVDLGGDAIVDSEDGGAEDRDPISGPQENAEARNVQAALIMRNLQRFAALAGPKFLGPREAVLGFAECSEALGNVGPAIEAYEAAEESARDDDKPPAWVMEVRAKLKALKK